MPSGVKNRLFAYSGYISIRSAIRPIGMDSERLSSDYSKRISSSFQDNSEHSLRRLDLADFQLVVEQIFQYTWSNWFSLYMHFERWLSTNFLRWFDLQQMNSEIILEQVLATADSDERTFISQNVISLYLSTLTECSGMRHRSGRNFTLRFPTTSRAKRYRNCTPIWGCRTEWWHF